MLKTRLGALDGLRGIAILAVILNHLPNGILYKSLPGFARPLLDILLVNGRIGVCILFMLTGFLMAWLHPAPSTAVSFWSRRYARLFPAFLTMVVSWAIIRGLDRLPILTEIGVVLACALIGRGLWELGFKISEKMPIGKWLTLFWITVQIGVAGWYVFFLLKVPPSVFYQLWSPVWRWITIGLVNATLTLPFGNYIGQLDGVYWSLITETLFYLLYPILFVPIFQYINRKRSKIWKILLLITVFPFCFGLHAMSQRFLRFGIIAPHLIIYFIFGVAIGSNLSIFHKWLSKIPRILLRPVFLLPVLVVIFSGVLLAPFLPKLFQPDLELLLVLPMSLLVLVSSAGGRYWGKWLENRWLVFLGKYSYSLYLTHAFCIDLVERIIKPTAVISWLWFTIAALIASVILSWCLFQLVEKPYYSLGKKFPKKNEIKILPNETFIASRSKRVVFVFSVVIFLITYVAYRSPLAFFTYVHAHGRLSILSMFGGEKKMEINRPIRFSFVGQESGLGMITTYLKNSVMSGEEASAQPAELHIALKDEEDRIISQAIFNPGVIPDSRFHPFGFPLQADSEEEDYVVEYRIIPPDSNFDSEIITTEENFLVVYFPGKKVLLKNPKLFARWLVSKIKEPFDNPMFWFVTINMFPLLLVLWAIYIPKFMPSKVR